MLNGVPRILIVRLSAIGDVVRVLPALHALRDRYPHAQIDWAVEPKSSAILEGHPALDQVLIFPRSESALKGILDFRRFCAEIRANRYDIVLDFHGIIKSGLILRASKAAERFAFVPPRSQELSHLFANRRVRLPVDRMNRIEENLELCKALGAKRHHLDVAIPISEEIEDEVHPFFVQSFHASKRIVAIHPPVDRPEKQWPLEHYAELCDRLLADGRFEVFLTYGPGQRDIVEKVRAMAHRGPVIAPESPSLPYYAALVKGADLYFGGDTGPMHIASAVGVPVVGVFGGTDPARHAPLREPSVVLYSGPEPFPQRITLEEAHDYMRAVSAEAAYDACVGLFRSR